MIPALPPTLVSGPTTRLSQLQLDSSSIGRPGVSDSIRLDLPYYHLSCLQPSDTHPLLIKSIFSCRVRGSPSSSTSFGSTPLSINLILFTNSHFLLRSTASSDSSISILIAVFSRSVTADSLIPSI